MKKLVISLTVCVLVLGVTGSAEGRRGTPPGILIDGAPDFAAVEHLVLPTPDLDKILAKDRDTVGRVRVAETIAVGRTMAELAAWERLADGSQRWRLRVSSPGAYFLSFQLSDFRLPPKAEMHFISVARNYYDGPYSARHNNVEGAFASPMVPDDSAMLEVWIPARVKRPNFRLEAVSWGYKNFRDILSMPLRDGRQVRIPEKARPFGNKAAGCIDQRCPAGDAWENQSRSVAEGYDGNFICSGSVLNSTDNDCTEYHYLTANHCFSKGKAKRLVFYWNYKNSTCGGNDASIDDSTTGSTYLAGGNASDFYLVRLNETPPESYAVSQSGFDATGNVPQSGATMGFPNDVPMTVAVAGSPLRDGQSDGWGDDHWRGDSWDDGGTDGGSSGGGLFDQNKRVVGQLHGGIGTCGDGGWDEYGKLSVSWAAGAEEHLDPGSTGQLTTDLIDCFGGEPPPPPPPCDAGQRGDPCTVDDDCCSLNCRQNGKWANTCG